MDYFLNIEKPDIQDVWLVVEKSSDSSTGYNFSHKLIIALLEGFRKQELRKEELLCTFLEHGLLPKMVRVYMRKIMENVHLKFGWTKNLKNR